MGRKRKIKLERKAIKAEQATLEDLVGKELLEEIRFAAAYQRYQDEKLLVDMEKELNGIRRLFNANNNNKTPLQAARELIYSTLLEGVKAKGLHDKDDEINFDNLKKAGQLLYDAEGMRGLRDPLLWAFIPKCLQRTIDIAFDGIGEWKA